jgi:hypothetical protein
MDTWIITPAIRQQILRLGVRSGLAQSQRTSTTVNLKFEPFFHPYVPEFIKGLNHKGIPGLLNLKNQTLGNPYLHSPWKSGYTISTNATGSACLIEGGFGRKFLGAFQSARPGNFEALILEGNEIRHYSHDSSDVTKLWNKLSQITTQATGAACITERLSKRVVTASEVVSPGNFEAVVIETNKLQHYSRNNSAPGNPWTLQGTVTNQATGSGCIIESSFITANQKCLEAVVLEGSNLEHYHNLVHYQRDNADGQWKRQGEFITDKATGPGCIIQSSFASGQHGNFEVVVLEGSQLVHYWKDNAANKWHRGKVITDVATTSGWIVQSRVSDSQTHSNFEVVVCEGRPEQRPWQLVHYWKDNSDTGSPWRRGQVITTNATGSGCIIQSNFGNIGNFEVVVPEKDSEGNPKLVHYWNVNEGSTGSEGERFYFKNTYQPTGYVDDPYPRHEVDFSFGGAYSLYNWELFFHAPMLLASRLSQNQRFANAMRWYHYIFDPTDDSNELTTHRYWKVLPFRDVEKLRIDHMLALLSDPTKKGSPERQNVVDQLNDWGKNPFKPHRIARFRRIAYQKNVLMKYIDNLMAWGDQLFRQDTIESINEATQLYILAANLLGPRPQNIPERGKKKPQTYAQLRSRLDEFSNAKSTIENEFPHASVSSSTQITNETTGLLSIGDTFYFCIPQNEKLLGYWDTVADRLFKIRHCMNIEGVVRQLPLFEPPIDPALLVQAAAKGVDLSSVLSDLSSPLPHYRFSYMLQKALEVCAEVRSLGAAMLAALEKRDAEELAAVRARQEVQILNLVKEVKQQQYDEAVASYAALEKSKDVPIQRFLGYQTLLGVQSPQVPGDTAQAQPTATLGGQLRQGAEGGLPLLEQEQIEIDASHSARDWNVRASTMKTLASLSHYIPSLTASLQPLGVGGQVAFGGDHVGPALLAFAGYQESLAAQDSYDASHAGRLAVHWRKLQDWTHQSKIAEQEILQINKQLIAAKIRQQIAEKELKNHEQQIENAQAIEEFLRDKYTNTELYSWMQGEISALYFQCYQLAYDLAKKAERCFRFERGLTNSNYIQFGYWDNLRKGLLSGERLYLALKQLERAYHDQNKREYEISKNVSLVLHNPLALIALKETGTCIIEFPESLFDADYPGHYMRRLKSVSLTIPCVVGSYTSINCTLMLLANKTRVSSNAQGSYPEDSENEDPRFVTNFAAMQSIATSTAQNDSGLFELSFRDERYLPFEGAGAISRWRIDMPKDCNAFDFDTVSDVIIKLNYCAREGGELLKAAAKKALQTEIGNTDASQLFRLFSLQHEFPTDWHRFLYPATPAAGQGILQTIALNLNQERFPFQFRGKKVSLDSVVLFLNIKEGITYNSTHKLKIRLNNNAGNDFDLAGSPVSGLPFAKPEFSSTDIPTQFTLEVRESDLPLSAPSGTTWWQKVNINGIEHTQLKPEAIEDIWIVCHHSVKDSDPIQSPP